MSAGISSARPPAAVAPTSPVSELSTVTNFSAFTTMSSSSPVPADMGLVLQERDALRQQNEQLWALVEKQRQVIFSLKTQITQLRAAPSQGHLTAGNGIGPGPSPSPTTAMLESPSLALPPNGPVPSAADTAAAQQQQQQQPRQRTPPMQMQIQPPQRANTVDGIPTPPNDSPVAAPLPAAVIAPTRSRSFSNPTAPAQSSALANPPMAVPSLPPKHQHVPAVISAPPTTSSPPAIVSPVRMAPSSSISSAPNAPMPPSRSNTYPSTPSSTGSPDQQPPQPPQQPSTPQRSATLDQPPPKATSSSSPRKSLTITPMRVANASDHIEPLSPKPVVAGGPASRASVISLNDPRYSYLAYYDDLMTDPDEGGAHASAPAPAAAPESAAAAAVETSSNEAAAEAADQVPTDLPPSNSPTKKSIVPANKAFRLGRLRPSSQLAQHEVRPTARVQFAQETIIHEASDEEWGSDGEESFSNGAGDDSQWNASSAGDGEYYDDDGESVDGSDLTGSDMAVAVPPTQFAAPPPAPAQQGGVQFPPRSRSSMVAPPPSSSRMSQASGRVPPPRQHSRTHARDSIFLTKKNGGMYNPPRAFVNETRMSMMGNNVSAMAALQGGGASGLPQPTPAPAPAGQPQFPTRGAASIQRGMDPNAPALPSPTTAAPPAVGAAGLPPMRTAASPSAARASQFYQPPPAPQAPHPVDHIDEELIRRLLSGDRSQLQEQLKGLSPTQIAALQNMLRDRMQGGGAGGPQQGRPMSPRTGP